MKPMRKGDIWQMDWNSEFFMISRRSKLAWTKNNNSLLNTSSYALDNDFELNVWTFVVCEVEWT